MIGLDDILLSETARQQATLLVIESSHASW